MHRRAPVTLLTGDARVATRRPANVASGEIRQHDPTGGNGADTKPAQNGVAWFPHHGELICPIAKWMLTFSFALAAVAPVHAAEGDGLNIGLDDSNVTWARWQARLAVSQPAPLWRTSFGDADSSGLAAQPQPDGRLSVPPAPVKTADGSTGVLRATSGLVLARARPWRSVSRRQRRQPTPAAPTFGDARNDAGALPYVGVGYSGLAGHRAAAAGASAPTSA